MRQCQTPSPWRALDVVTARARIARGDLLTADWPSFTPARHFVWRVPSFRVAVKHPARATRSPPHRINTTPPAVPQITFFMYLALTLSRNCITALLHRLAQRTLHFQTDRLTCAHSPHHYMDTADMQTDTTRHTAPRAATMAEKLADIRRTITVTDPARRKAKRTKIKIARSRLLLILACLAYIVTVFTTLGMGLQDISQYLKPRLQHARIELSSLGSARFQEQKVSMQLEELLGTRLGHGYRFGEKYEDCLVRGLQTANQKFDGLGFQYPDVRQQSMEWTTDNCKQLIYVPQPMQLSLIQQFQLTPWASATYRARRIFETTIDVVALGWKRLATVLGIRPAKIAPKPADACAPARKHNLFPVHTRMPFGFELDCSGTDLCRLTYPRTSAAADHISVSRDELVKNIRRVDTLSRFCCNVSYYQSFMASLALLFTALMVLPAVSYLAAGIYLAKGMPYPQANANMTQRPVKDVNRFTPEELYTAGSLLLQTVVMILHMIVQLESFQPGYSTMITGIAMLMVGVSMAINLFIPVTPQLERFSRMREAFKDLYLMIAAELKQPAAVPPQANETVSTPAAAEEVIAEQSEEEPAPAGSPMPSASVSRTSTPARSLSVSLASTVQDDLRDELDTVRQERSYEASMESESDSDFDGEQYIDLTDCATPTTTEADSHDAVVVDA
jgi:hypothetical protein